MRIPSLILGTLFFCSGLAALAAADRPAQVPEGATYFEKTKVWVRDVDGARTVWSSAGQVIAQGALKDGKRQGDWKFYFRNGKLKGEGAFAESRMQGLWKLYHPNGKLASEGKYENNYRAGEWTMYAREGWKKSVCTFHHGYRQGPCVEYYPGGEKVFYKGAFHQDKEHGQWEYFTLKGKLVQSGVFKHGVRVGKWYVCVMGQCGYKTFKLSEVPRPSGSVSDAQNKKEGARDPYADIMGKKKGAGNAGDWDR